MASSEKLVDAATEAIKTVPPIAVIGAPIAGFTLQDWVYVVTLVYLGAQIGWLLWRWWKAAHTPGWEPNE